MSNIDIGINQNDRKAIADGLEIIGRLLHALFTIT